MVSIPGFLLKSLYVKGSLKNSSGGFEFQLKNGLGSGYAYRMDPLIVDGNELPLDSTFFYVDGKEIPFSTVSKENTFTLAMNRTITVWVDGVILEPIDHKLEMGFDVPGLGTMQFDFRDVVANG